MTDSTVYSNPCQLYVISPPRIELDAFAESLKAALAEGGVGAFQLRLKSDKPPAKDRTTIDHAETDVIRRACAKLIPICHAYEVAFILNDSAKLARECHADGVHLGQEDGSVKAARAILGEDAAIGVSCHDSRHLGMEAGEAGADYVAFGAFYPTTSKTPEALAKYGTPEVSFIEWWSVHTVLPSVAIGGMTPENCAPLVKAGADFIAAITAVWQAEDGPAAAVKRFRAAMG